MLLAESEESYLLHQTPGQFYTRNEKLAYGKKQGKKSDRTKCCILALLFSMGKKKKVDLIWLMKVRK